MTMRTIVGVAAVLLAAGWASSCGAAGETQRETQAIELDKTEMARVEIKIGAGELRVKSGTPKLMEAEFAYNVAAWKPVVNYRADASRGTLTISQPDSTGAMGNTVNTWDLTLNDTLPLDLATSMGAGEANLELGRMNLRNLEVNVGVGELRVDLRGEPKQD